MIKVQKDFCITNQFSNQSTTPSPENEIYLEGTKESSLCKKMRMTLTGVRAEKRILGGTTAHVKAWRRIKSGKSNRKDSFEFKKFVFSASYCLKDYL